jgi:hypothetical protein
LLAAMPAGRVPGWAVKDVAEFMRIHISF